MLEWQEKNLTMEETYSLISLNCWNGRRSPELFKFFEETRGTTDIYCFQEMLDGTQNVRSASGTQNNLLTLTKEILNPAHTAFINRQQYWQSNARTYSIPRAPWGLAVLHGIEMRKNLFVKSWSNEFLIGHMDSCLDTELEIEALPVVLQKIQFITPRGKRFSVFNLHGYYAGYGNGKGDTEKRLNQAMQIAAILRKTEEPWILCGDFNMTPDSKSLRVIADSCECAHLIEQYGIPTTRTTLYPKEKWEKNPHADYVFTRGVEIDSFRVDSECLASDHAPLFLTFSV